MELLLNLLWLVLAVPAVLVWRRHAVSSQEESGAHRSRSFILLGCLLALLFPVVSATDDLHAMCQEVEESSPSKRMVKTAATVKTSICTHTDIPPATLISVDLGSVDLLGFTTTLQVCTSLQSCFRPAMGCRAPPFLFVC